MRDITLEDTFQHDFTTRAFATGVPGTLGGTPVLSVLEGNNATPITAGVSVSVDRASVAGLNEATIVATAANGYEAGKSYSIYISTGTVGGVSVIGEVVGQFTVGASAAAVDLANGTDGLGALKTLIDSLLESLIMQKTTIATLASQTSFTLTAGSADNDAYNEATIVIVDSSTAVQKAFGSLSNYIGSSKTVALAQDPGIFTMAVGDTVYILPSDSFAIIDAVLLGNTHNVQSSLGRRIRGLQDFGLYESGLVWLDTVNGVPGTTDFENGTVNNPTDLIASAITIMNSINLPGIHVIPGSSITLAATINAKEIFGVGYTLVLGGQNIDNMHFFNADSVTGIGTSATEVHFNNCTFGTASIQKAICTGCTFSSTITMTLAGNYSFINCQSGVAGAAAPTFTKTAGQVITAEWRRWSNGITVSGIESGDVMTISGTSGTITLSGADGTVEVRGIYKAIVDNRTGSPTLNTDGAIKGVDVASTLADTNELQTDWADGGRLDLLLDAVPADVLAAGDIDGFTLEEAQKLQTASLAGKLSGAATSTNTIRAADDSKNRITATVDANGNRTAITLDVTG